MKIKHFEGQFRNCNLVKEEENKRCQKNSFKWVEDYVTVKGGHPFHALAQGQEWRQVLVSAYRAEVRHEKCLPLTESNWHWVKLMDEFFPFTVLKHRFSFYFQKDPKWCFGGDWQSLNCFHLSGSRTLIIPLLNKDKLYMFLTSILLSLWLFICLTFLFLFWPIQYQISLFVCLVIPFILE